MSGEVVIVCAGLVSLAVVFGVVAGAMLGLWMTVKSGSTVQQPMAGWKRAAASQQQERAEASQSFVAERMRQLRKARAERPRTQMNTEFFTDISMADFEREIKESSAGGYPRNQNGA